MLFYALVAVVASLIGFCTGATMASSKFQGLETRLLHLVLSIYRFTEKYDPPKDAGKVDVLAEDIRTLREIAQEAE